MFLFDCLTEVWDSGSVITKPRRLFNGTRAYSDTLCNVANTITSVGGEL
jgi:hypothetical protein